MNSRNSEEVPKVSNLSRESLDLRFRVIDILSKAGRGHLGPALSIIDIIDTLYSSVLSYEKSNPQWLNRDRFILSKGHGCLGLYVVLEKYGFFKSGILDDFCSFDSLFGGHPESATVPGVEFSTGSLGHGLSFGVGLAMAARIQKKNWRTFVLLGDGELNEGSVWEAVAHASKHQLGNLCAIVDFNEMQASGLSSEVLNMNSLSDKFEAFGFQPIEIDGHDPIALKTELNFISSVNSQPRVIIAKTVKGKGIPLAENSSYWHHRAKISHDEINALKDSIII